MIAYLEQLDRALFLVLNNDLANSIFDFLLPWWRHRFFWIPLYACVLYLLPKRYGKEGWFMIGFLLLTFALSDSVSAQLIKPLLHRLRPCHEPLLLNRVRVLVPCGSGFSFPSSHATNHVAFAICLAFMLPQWRKRVLLLGLLWAFSISFAQVYVGLHYPFDVIGGAVLGASIGGGMAVLFNRKIKGTYL